MESDSMLVCPECMRARVKVVMRSLADGSAQCWGVCEGCGARIKGGALPGPRMFDAEAKVADECLRRRGMA